MSTFGRRLRATTSAPGIAKLARPRLHAVAERERVFLALDEASARPVVWVAAHPGAGKTTAVATWIESRGLRDTWLQADTGDSDPGTFFSYLGRCAPGPRMRQGPPETLPLLTPEHQADLPGFGRRYFRALFARLPPASVLVLDNFQEVAEDSDLHLALAAAFEEVPADRTLVVVSRVAPPEHYARLVANRSVAVIEWPRLRLTPEETLAIVSEALPGTSADVAEQLHRQCGGWAAGLTLMLERLRQGEFSDTAFEAETREATFRYFAGEVFGRLPLDQQQVLIACAYLPRTTPHQAEILSGHAGAGRLLEALYRRHLFTDRRAGTEPVYQFHALFREFLLSRAVDWYTQAGRGQIARRAAAVLEDAGDFDAATALALAAEDWSRAARLILHLAPALLAQGRARTLTEWVEALPARVRAVDSWLDYWRGAALVPTQHARAREILEPVLDRFTAEGNRTGRVLSLCGLMESHYLENQTFAPLEALGEQLEAALGDDITSLGPALELRAATNLLNAGQFTRITDPRLRDRAERMLEILALDVGAAEKITAAHTLLRFVAWSADFSKIDRVAALTRPLLEHPAVSALNRFVWWVRLAHCCGFACRWRETEVASAQADSIAADLPRNPATLTLATQFVALAIFEQDIDKARALIAQRVAPVRIEAPFEMALEGVARQLVAAAEGSFALALHWAKRAIDGFGHARNVGAETEFRIKAVHYLFELGRPGEAAALGDAIRARVSGSFLAHYEATLDLMFAYHELRQGAVAACDALLRRALPRVPETTLFPLLFLPHVLPAVLGRALAAGIEPDIVRRAISLTGLRPEGTDNAAWPWPVSISVLGGFELHLEPPPASPRKPQRKLHELLQVVVALGGRGVSAHTVADILWPDTDGDTARRNLDVYLTRLRKLLRHPEAVFVRDGRIHLNPAVCWVDTWAFEHHCARLRAWRDGEPVPADSANRIRTLYRGPLLAGNDAPWVLAPRAHLQRAWHHAAERWPDAAPCPPPPRR